MIGLIRDRHPGQASPATVERARERGVACRGYPPTISGKVKKMAIRLKSLKADLKTEREGDWVSYPDFGDPEVAFKVRAMTSPEYQARFDREVMKLSQKHGQTVPREDRDRVLGQLMAEEILLDWRGLDEPFSAEKAMDLLTDPAYRELRIAVETCAMRLTRLKVDFVETEGKNSAQPSEQSLSGKVKHKPGSEI